MRRTAALISIVLVLVVATVGTVSWLSTSHLNSARAVVEPGLDLSISTGACDSSSGPTTCIAGSGANFTVGFNVKALGAALSTNGYAGYDVEIAYSGAISYLSGSLSQVGPGTWPDCSFPTGAVGFGPGDAKTMCSSFGNSFFLGQLMHLDFHCDSVGQGTLTLVHGDGSTDIIDLVFAPHSEASDESLTMDCQVLPTPTMTSTLTFTTQTPPSNTSTATPTRTPAKGGPTGSPTYTVTPGGPTNTPTRTPTHAPSASPTPPSSPTSTLTPTDTPTPNAVGTNTSTPPPSHSGDANGDGATNAVDATITLQFAAGMLSSIDQAADVNRDGVVNAIDASLILQYAAGLIPSLPV